MEVQKKSIFRVLYRKVRTCLKKRANCWIWFWAGISVAFMLVIHIAFSFSGPEWLRAKWGAGDILTYASTVSLGLLALWQNQRIQIIQGRKDKHQLAVEHFALFDYVGWNADFYLSSNTDYKKRGKIIDSGFNGNKAIWKLQSLDNMDKLKLTFSIKNIGNTPANHLQVVDSSGERIPNTNVLYSDDGVNDRRYILDGRNGELIIIVDLKELEKAKKLEYILSFWNPFGSHYGQNITVRSTYTDRIIQIDAGCTLEILNDGE